MLQCKVEGRSTTGPQIAVRYLLTDKSHSLQIHDVDDGEIVIDFESDNHSVAICLSPDQFKNLAFHLESYCRDRDL